METGKPHILVVDDEELNRDLLSRRLSRAGYLVTTAAGGREALACIARAPYSLVLLDVMMPELNGISMLELLRATTSADVLPVIMATAIGDSETIVEALAAGANDYVTKPLDFPVVLARIEAQLKRRTSYATLSLREDRYSQALQSSRAAVWDLDTATRQLTLSQEWLRTIADPEANLRISLADWVDCIAEEDRPRVLAAIEPCCLSGGPPCFDVEFRICRRDGRRRRLHVLAHALFDGAGRVDRLVGSQTDVTEMRQLDSSTLLPNREGAIEFLSAIQQSGMYSLAALCLRFTEFESVCRGMESSASDGMMASVARLVEEALSSIPPEADTAERRLVARTGEDEISVIFAWSGCAANGQASAQAIARSVSAGAIGQKVCPGLRLLAGYASDASFTMLPELILSNARIASFTSATLPPGSVAVYDASMRASILMGLRVDELLSSCLEKGSLRAVYQPIVRAADDAVAGVEALLRLKDRDSGFVSPAQFIPKAERSGQIHVLGEWILAQSCGDLASMRREGSLGFPLHLSVNLSVLQLRDTRLPEKLAGILASTGLAPQRLSLEITESVLLDAEGVILDVLNELRGLGVGLSLDDFGTGYSSLETLLRVPLTSIKIDRSLIRAFHVDGRAEKIVESVVSIARNLHCQTVAEGVETPEQYHSVVSLGCDFIQGFLVSKPVDIGRLPAVLATWRSPLRSPA